MRYGLVLVIIVVGAVAWVVEAEARAGTQRTAGNVASALAGRPVTIHCQSLWANLLSINSNLGEVKFDAAGHPADSAWLARDTCGYLKRFISSNGADLECLKTVDWSRFQWNGPRDACITRAAPEGQAVIALAHEAMHLRGIGSESEAQCGAEEAATRTVTLLGGDPTTGPFLERLARAWNPTMPTDYQAPDCP